MTVKECYEQMGSDYEGVLGRMGSEAMIKLWKKMMAKKRSAQHIH